MKRIDDEYRRVTRRRTSLEVITPLLVTAGLIGVPLAIGLSSHSDDDDDDTQSPAPTVDAGTAYPMNHFLPGAGYYHAPYHTWFPLPFNSYDATRGWYRGGQWRRAAQEDAAEQAEVARLNGLAARSSSSGTGGSFARMMTSRPDPAAVQRANVGAAAHHSANVIRGGFGHSSHPSIS